MTAETNKDLRIRLRLIETKHHRYKLYNSVLSFRSTLLETPFEFCERVALQLQTTNLEVITS